MTTATPPLVSYSRDPGSPITPINATGRLIYVNEGGSVALIETSDGAIVDCWLGGEFNLERVGDDVPYGKGRR